MSDKSPDLSDQTDKNTLPKQDIAAAATSADSDDATIVNISSDQAEWWKNISPPEEMPKQAPWLDHADLEAATNQRKNNQISDNWPETGRSNLPPLLRLGLMLVLGTAIIGGYILLFRQI